LENVFILFQYLNPLPGFGRKYELGVNNLTEYVGIFSYGIPTPCIPQTYIAFGWYGVILWFVIGKLVKYIVLSVVKYTSMLVIVSSFLCVISFGISIHSPLR